jgi:hypothetical protein
MRLDRFAGQLEFGWELDCPQEYPEDPDVDVYGRRAREADLYG